MEVFQHMFLSKHTKGLDMPLCRRFPHQQLFPLSSSILMHGECAFAMEGKSDVTTRIFDYIQYIPRNDMYPICILWVLTTIEFWCLVISRLLGYYCYLRNSIEPRTVRNWEQNRTIALRMLKDRGHFYGHNFTKRITISNNN